MRENEYQVIYRDNEIKYFQRIADIKVEGSAYIFYREGEIYYSVPVDLVQEINIVK
ncbi:hypothetical protein P4604_16820 [Lysinibacillus capsici]|uniref:hypothetical protein n=1 Tax=Lysinibacillus capsici TaxID=2115968 RepID=UPI002E1BAB88|nr:hypothetical protein [Lysinibacillus capsici]